MHRSCRDRRRIRSGSLIIESCAGNEPGNFCRVGQGATATQTHHHSGEMTKNKKQMTNNIKIQRTK